MSEQLPKETDLTPIRQLPAVQERVETGPIAFGDDWPGVFIRGDHALLAYLPAVRDVLNSQEFRRFGLISRAQLEGLGKLLESCSVVRS